MRMILGFCLIAFASCKVDPIVPETQEKYVLDLPEGFPQMNVPSDNELTQERIDLGKNLFFDTRLSGDNSVSCGSCHNPELSFADDVPISPGIEQRLGFRNAPSLANVGYKNRLFADGGVSTLEFQVLAPMDSHEEMDVSVLDVAEILKADPSVNALSQKAYGRDVDPFVITRSIAAFERTLVSGNSPYDRYINGDLSALSEPAIAGMNLFFSPQLACSSCHSTFLFSDGNYYNIGLEEVYADNGRERITSNASDNGKFMTPSLRNIALTAPYMHNGSIPTLEAVIEHFNAGGVNHTLQDARIQPLNLTSTQKDQLVSFLYSLTDVEFIENPNFRPE
ncbi:MAG: cytochrome-c peroxidase [Flavobacteriales bacterium]|nr:cytochrome-c peroxidase [Flavobacteriales bacterium]